MKIKLLHDARVEHKAGEVVEASPVYASILIGNGMAEPVAEDKEQPKKKTTKK